MLSVSEGLYGQTWSWRLQENELLFSQGPASWYTWDLKYLRFIYLCLWFAWDFLIYLTFEILEIHLPVFVIYLRLLDILDFWNTWDSSTCVCDLHETSWYTWLLKYLRFIYLCLWFTWDFLIYLTLEILEIHLPVFVIYLRLFDILETWITWDSVTCVWVTYLRLFGILEIWMIWDSSFYLWFTSFQTYSYECVGWNIFEKPVIDMRMHRLKVIKWYLLWIDDHFLRRCATTWKRSARSWRGRRLGWLMSWEVWGGLEFLKTVDGVLLV